MGRHQTGSPPTPTFTRMAAFVSFLHGFLCNYGVPARVHHSERRTPHMAVSTKAVALPERVSFARIPDIRPMPGLIQIQLDSFEWFKQEGLRELFEEISPIEDFTGKNLKLEFIVPPEPFGKPKYSEDECRDRDATYAAPLTVKARLTNKETGEIIEKDIFMGDFPLM